VPGTARLGPHRIEGVWNDRGRGAANEESGQRDSAMPGGARFHRALRIVIFEWTDWTGLEDAAPTES